MAKIHFKTLKSENGQNNAWHITSIGIIVSSTKPTQSSEEAEASDIAPTDLLSPPLRSASIIGSSSY
jgi:hypothetical protein